MPRVGWCCVHELTAQIFGHADFSRVLRTKSATALPLGKCGLASAPPKDTLPGIQVIRGFGHQFMHVPVRRRQRLGKMKKPHVPFLVLYGYFGGSTLFEMKPFSINFATTSRARLRFIAISAHLEVRIGGRFVGSWSPGTECDAPSRARGRYLSGPSLRRLRVGIYIYGEEMQDRPAASSRHAARFAWRRR